MYTLVPAHTTAELRVPMSRCFEDSDLCSYLSNNLEAKQNKTKAKEKQKSQQVQQSGSFSLPFNSQRKFKAC